MNQINKVRVHVYEPAMCCPTGLCGPEPDPRILKANETFLALKKQGIEVARHNLKDQLADFLSDKTVADMLHKNGKKVLPLTLVDGCVIKSGSYPEYEEFCKALGLVPDKAARPVLFSQKEGD